MSEYLTTTIASTFDMDSEFNDERFCRVRMKVMHSGLNRNQSYFDKDVIEKAKDSFKLIPILADVQPTDNEELPLDYTAHSMHIEKDAFDESNYKLMYDEKVVGVIPEQNDYELILNEETGNYEVFVTGLLYREYGNYVCDILEKRGGETKVSMEIICNDVSYNLKGNYLEVNDMVAQGVTLLGSDVEEGMKGANAKTFSKSDEDITKQMLSFMQEVKESLDKYINLAKGGNTMFEKLLEKYNKTVDDIDFEYEGLSDEELEKAFASRFDEDASTEGDDTVEPVEESVEPAEDNDEPAEDNDAVEDGDVPTEDAEPTEEPVVVEESVEETEPADTKYSFEISVNEKLCALYELVNQTYGEESEYGWLDVSVYDNYLVMYEWGSSYGYKQEYSETDGKFSLVGERVEVESVWITKEEKAQLDEMKANYDAVVSELENYKSEPEKQEILSSKEYSSVADTDEYKALCDEHFSLSAEEIRQKADQILLGYAKKNASTFKVGVKRLPNLGEKKTKRYGNIFDK